MRTKLFYAAASLCLSVGVASATNAPDSILLKQMNEVAAGIKLPASVQKGTTKITIPQVANQYTLELRGTDCLPVIDRSGTIFTPLTDADVQLYFQLTDKASGTKVDVPNIKVSVPGEFKQSDSKGLPPRVIPSLREWLGYGGSAAMPAKGEIILDPAFAQELQEGMQLFASDLKEQSNYNYKVKTGAPAKGKIYVTLNTEDKSLGKEGYRLMVGDTIKIEAVDKQGAFWATRTLLQMVQQYGEQLPMGVARDYPKYEKRGFMLDVARKFFRLNFLQDYVKIMSYYKMNEFHVHLNDNAFVQFFDNDWDKTYAAFRLESEAYPGLTAKDGSYSKKEFTNLQRQGMAYGVNIIPEIDVPAHSLAFSHYKPSLGSKKYGMDHLDLMNPEVYDFVDGLFKEYVAGENPVFIGPDVHIGTDEYDKAVAEEFRKFTDHYLRLIQGYGKRARLWGALTHAKGNTPVTSEGVIMNAWYNGYADPRQMIEEGYELISTPDGLLYIVPAAGYYYDYLNGKHLYDKWEPITIGREVFPYGHPQISGGMFAVWNDHTGNGISEKDVHHRAFPAMQVLAEKMWDGNKENPDYEGFAKVAASMIEAPGVNVMGNVVSNGPIALSYNFTNAKGKDISGNGYNVAKAKGVKYNAENGALLSGNSVIETPVEEIGYNYAVSFDIKPEGTQAKDAVLFNSANAQVVVNEAQSGNLAFKRDGYTYSFDYAPVAGQWNRISIHGDNKGTSLYVNGELKQRLEGNKKEVTDAKGKKSTMHLQQTLVFPLKQIGATANGFNGGIRSLKVEKL